MGGKEAEDAAAAYLQQQGLVLLARNWRCRGGEIGLVCQHGPSLVFIEVRARSRSDYSGAAASITSAKRQRLIHAARQYLASQGRIPPCRFDAVLVEAGKLSWLQDAFQADG